MLPNLPKNWVFNEKIPFQESNLVEFKEVAVFDGLFNKKSPPGSGLPKYRETIMGFLNGGCGYLFMGIRDDGAILGVSDMTDEKLDKLKLWVDSTFNILIHKDGRPLDPTKTSLNVKLFPVENAPYANTYVVMIEVIHKGPPLDIMTRSGIIIYRLNASNYKICSEPMYRKRDVKGMIDSIQRHMQEIIKGQQKAIQTLQDRHAEELQEALQKERNEVRMYVSQISNSLYIKYKMEDEKESWCTYLLKCFT